MKMQNRFIDLTLSASSSSCDKNDKLGGHFKWDSIKKFIYIAYAFSSTSSSFDIFSKLLVVRAHLFEYILYVIFIGVSYMFMDFFIKQYVRKLDTNETLNPLMRGISFGILLQTALWAILYASDLADSIRFFIASMNKTPSWSKCQKVTKNVTCTSPQDIMLHCRDKIILNLNSTSAHLHYVKMFSTYDRNSMSMRLFVIGTVWICNFFIATMADKALLKLFKFSFMWGIFSTAFILIFLIFTNDFTSKAFYELMDIRDFFHIDSFNLITDPFGVGLIGAYDFGTMNPFTMVDNAILIFTIIFICTAFIRSLIVQVLYLSMKNCVYIHLVDTPHYLLFAILPLSTEFVEVKKIFVLYFYSYLSVALVACLAMFTATTSRILHSEYQFVKNIYIVGLLCFLGFVLSMPLLDFSSHTKMGLLYGLNTCTLCLGASKVVIVMWIYGVQKFSTDIHFWLGFKPTQFWKYIWTMLPVYLLVLVCSKIVNIATLREKKPAAKWWIAFTLVIVVLSQIRVLIKYFLKNNIAGIFKTHFKYGPPEADDRNRRKNFDEIVQTRQCRHDCLVLDERYECNHLPLIYRSNIRSTESSLTNIYVDSSKKKPSSVIDVSTLQMN